MVFTHGNVGFDQVVRSWNMTNICCKYYVLVESLVQTCGCPFESDQTFERCKRTVHEPKPCTPGDRNHGQSGP